MTDRAPEAQLSKVSDASIRERTGRGWDEWFALLDARGATGHTHTEITRWLTAEPLAFFDFIHDELPGFLARWQKIKEELRASRPA